MSDESSEVISADLEKKVSPELDPNKKNELHFEPVKVNAMKNNNKEKKTLSTFIIWLALILVLVSLAASAYLWQQFQQLPKDLLTNTSYQLDLKNNQQTITELQKSLNKTEEKLANSEASLSALKADQDKVISKISNISGVNRVDWLVDELQHLSRLAHQRLVLSQDANGAMALLQAADKVVVEMRESSALPIRQAIASDLIELEIAANIDLEGAYIRLNSLSTKVEDLTFKVASFPSSAELNIVTKENVKEENLEEGLGNKLQNALAHIVTKIQPYLYRSFTVEGEIKPTLSADERQYFSRNIQLTIEQAQLALLRRETESYRLSLEQCEDWIEEYYDTTDPATTTILTLLNELKGYDLLPKMPEINQTLDSVKDFSESWQEKKLQRTPANELQLKGV